MKGIYVLIIHIKENIEVSVGALGKIKFEKGFYAYVGSAQNSVEKRIKRHLRRSKRKFWHIDYLLDNSSVKIVKIFHKKAGKTEECKIAKKIRRKSVVAVKGFGSSDCKCESHLLKLDNYQVIENLMQEEKYSRVG
jgi:Uri superfamily endonuclease